MKNKILIICTLIFIFFIYLQRNYVNRYNNDIEIFQMENPNKKQFENQVDESYPSIFTNVSQNFKAIQEYSLASLVSGTKEKKREVNIKTF